MEINNNLNLPLAAQLHQPQPQQRIERVRETDAPPQIDNNPVLTPPVIDITARSRPLEVVASVVGGSIEASVRSSGAVAGKSDQPQYGPPPQTPEELAQRIVSQAAQGIAVMRSSEGGIGDPRALGERMRQTVEDGFIASRQILGGPAPLPEQTDRLLTRTQALTRQGMDEIARILGADVRAPSEAG